MNTSHPQLHNLPDDDLESLSAYIDDQLDPPARAALERRLEAEPRLRAELDDLRATAGLLRNLAPLSPPRSFTLDPATTPRRRPFLSMAWATQLGGGLAGLALVLLASVQILLGSGGAPAQAPAPAAVQAVPDEPPAGAEPFSAAAAPESTQLSGTARELAPTATLAPMATQAPPAEAPMMAEAAPTEAPAAEAGPESSQNAATARSAVATDSMASDTGEDGGSQAMGAAQAALPTEVPTAAIAASEPVSPQTASPELPDPAAAKQAEAPFELSPALLFGLGLALLALALGAFLYRRSS